MDADAAFELVVGQFAEGRDGVQLCVVGVCEQDLLLVGQFQQQVRVPAAFQDGGAQRPHQRLGGSGCLDGYPVAGFDLGGMVHQDFSKFFNTRICHDYILLSDWLSAKL